MHFCEPTLPTVPARAARLTARLTARVVASGALVLGALAAAPAPAAQAATAAPALTAGTAVSTATAVRPRRARVASRIDRAVDVARAQTGDPYRWGAAGPGAFDCSGLVYYSFRQAGFERVPRTSSAQAGFARRIPRSAMRRGDLVFFTDGGGVYHVGIYAGLDRGRRFIIHAPYGGTRVHRAAIWTDSWFAGTLR